MHKVNILPWRRRKFLPRQTTPLEVVQKTATPWERLVFQIVTCTWITVPALTGEDIDNIYTLACIMELPHEGE